MIGTESAGTITVKSDHFDGEFLNCFWRNNSDNHFRYYGRAISFPWQSSGWHYDRLFFENCTFTNLSRVVMMEGNEYASNVHLNHCTVVNTVEWVIQSGWLENVSVTNSIFVNPNMYGYRVYDLLDEGQDYDDWEDGLTDPPGGGLIDQITEVDSFGFEVDFTDADRKFYLANNVYMHRDYLVDWYVNAPWAQEKVRQRQPEETYHPSPMVGGSVIDMVDSVDSEGNKAFPKINIDWETIYDENPDFIVEPTKVDTMLLFVEQKWSDNGDYNWSFMPEAGLNQEWLLPENLAYNNETYKTAAMGGFPLGDLNWFPEQMSAWEAQRDTEWDLINSWLDGVVDVKEISSAVPTDYELSQNYPNPFNPTTKIHFAIPVKGHVSLKVYNNLGQEVATLFNGIQNAGNYEATFNASRLSSGVYFYELKTNDFTTTKKLMLLK